MALQPALATAHAPYLLPAPQAASHPATTQTTFSSGSSILSRADPCLELQSAYSLIDATGSPPPFGFPYTPNVSVPLPPFPHSSAYWPYDYFDKNQSWPPLPHQPSPAMAISYSPFNPLNGPAAHQSSAPPDADQLSPSGPPTESGSDSPSALDLTALDLAQAQAEDAFRDKRKKHPCEMCHKSFDRPSTLKKHMLVHTGEKAYVCDTCGRRFSVASNLNRHAKTCAQRIAAHSALALGTAGSAPSSPSAAHAGSSTHTILPPESAAPAPAPPRARKRKAAASPASPNANAGDTPPRPKRGRRAPSPSRWIPDSLRMFDLTPLAKASPVPLLPVHPFFDACAQLWEERDSYDENAAAAPYHPAGWRGRLPGPGLLARNVANTNANMGVGAERLLVF